tara:strand:- start:2368 stop:2577 length:210 start_codon:yes stop_codon:yes gene_type:complete
MTDEIKRAKQELVKKINKLHNVREVTQSRSYDMVATDPNTKVRKQPNNVPNVIAHKKANRKKKENIPFY